MTIGWRFILIGVVSAALLLSCGPRTSGDPEGPAAVSALPELSEWESSPNAEDFRRFSDAVSRLERHLPGVDYTVSLTAVAEVRRRGERLRNLVEEHTDLSFDEYNRLSIAVARVKAEEKAIERLHQIAADPDADADLREIARRRLDDPVYREAAARARALEGIRDDGNR